MTAAYDRKGHAPGSAPGAGPPPSAAGRRKLCQGEDSRPHPTSSPFSTSAVTAAATTRLRRTASRGSARSARSASTRAATSAARPCRRRTRAARRRAGPSAAAAPRGSATPAAGAGSCTSGPRPTSSSTPTARPYARRAGTTGRSARNAGSTSPQTTSKRVRTRTSTYAAGAPRGSAIGRVLKVDALLERANPSAPLEERCAAMGVTPEMRDAAALAAEALGEEDYEDLA